MALPKLLQKLFTNGGAGDKLNPDIMPDNYLPTSGGTVNGSVTINGTTVPVSGSTETYKEGIKFGWGSEISQSQPNGLDIWAKRGNATTVMALYGEKRDGDTTGDTPGIYLRAGDGTTTKGLRLSATKGLTADVCELKRSAGQKELIIGGADNDGCFHLYPGYDGSFSGKKSASLYLATTDYTGNTVQAGSFFLSAMNATTGVKTLYGSPDGSLTWCGASVWCGNAKWANRTNITIGQSFTAPSRGFVYSRGHSTSAWGSLRTSVNGILILGWTGKETDTGGTAYVNAGDTVIVSKDGTVSEASAIFVPIQ